MGMGAYAELREISDEAIKLAKDYDGMDDHGKRIVRVVADEELARIADERQRRLPVETEEEDNIVYVPLPQIDLLSSLHH